MSYEIGSIHRLHVINFNSEDSFSELSGEKFINDHQINGTSHANNTKEDLQSRTPNDVGKNAACMKIQSKSDTALRKRKRSPRVNNAIRRVFGETSFNPFKRSFHKRSISLFDLKQKLSSNSLIFTDRIKKEKKKVNQKAYPSIESYKDNNLQVLFTSKRKNFTKKFRNRNICRECRRLDLFYDSKSSGDFFGLNSNNNYRKPGFCHYLPKSQSRCVAACNFDYRNYRRDNGCIRKSQKEVEHTYRIASYGYTMPIYYKLVDCPCAFQPCHTEEQTTKLCGDETFRLEPCSWEHEQFSMTPSCFPISKKEAEVCEINSHCILNPNIETRSDDMTYNLNRIQDNLFKHRDCSGCANPFSSLSFDLANKPVSLAKYTLKYILFGLAVIAWSPCIITLCFYLLIMYPLRPQNIFRDNSETEDFHCQCGSCFKCRHNFLYSTLRYCVRLTKKVRYAYNCLYSLLKKQLIKPCPCYPRCNQVTQIQKEKPNPKKKYILIHSNSRGWLMKPIGKGSKKNNERDFHYKKNDSKVLQNHDCRCNSREQKNKTGHSNKESGNRIKLPNLEDSRNSSPVQHNREDKISNKQTPMFSKPSLKQRSMHETLEHKQYHDSSPVNEIESIRDKLKKEASDSCPLHERESMHKNLKKEDHDSSPIHELKSIRENLKKEDRDSSPIHELKSMRVNLRKEDRDSSPIHELKSMRINLKKENHDSSPIHELKSMRENRKKEDRDSSPIHELKSMRENRKKEDRDSSMFHENLRKGDRNSSPICKLERQNIFEKLPRNIRVPKNEIFNSPQRKPSKNVYFKGVSSPPWNMRDPLHHKLLRHPMANSGKLISGKSRPCCHKKIIYFKKGDKVRPRTVLNYKKYETKGRKLYSNLRVCCWCQSIRKNVRETINDFGAQSWKCDLCDDMFVYTLRKRPCFWIYGLSPSFYPYFLILHRFYKNLIHALMLLFSFCVWCPVIGCCYVFYSLCCRCVIN